MEHELLDGLRAANPVPELMASLPFSVVADRLDEQILAPTRADTGARRPGHLRPVGLGLGVLASAAVAVAALELLAGTGSTALGEAKAAIWRGERLLSKSTQPVLYSKEVFTFTRNGREAARSVTQVWQESHRGWRISTRPDLAGMSDFAQLGGVIAYYKPAENTLYVNRAKKDRYEGVFPGTDLLSTALGALLNVEPAGASGSASSFRHIVNRLSRVPGAHVHESHGMLTVTARRGRRSSEISIRVAGYKPLRITQTEPDANNHTLLDTDTLRFIVYDHKLPPAAAAGTFNLLHAFPTAHVKTTHHRLVQVP